MDNRTPTKPGRVLITPEDGSPAFYATMTRADEPTNEGTPLNKASLLKDATAALFGLDKSAVPDEALQAIAGVLDGLRLSDASSVKLVAGTYVGTGTYGADNPTDLELDFSPNVIFITRKDVYEDDDGGGNSNFYFAILFPPMGILFHHANEWGERNVAGIPRVGMACLDVAVNQNTITWNYTTLSSTMLFEYAASPMFEDLESSDYGVDRSEIQMNAADVTYNYLALGLGNKGLDLYAFDEITME